MMNYQLISIDRGIYCHQLHDVISCLAYSLSVRFTDYLNSLSLDEHHIYIIYSRIITLRTLSDMYARIPHNQCYKMQIVS